MEAILDALKGAWALARGNIFLWPLLAPIFLIFGSIFLLAIYNFARKQLRESGLDQHLPTITLHMLSLDKWAKGHYKLGWILVIALTIISLMAIIYSLESDADASAEREALVTLLSTTPTPTSLPTLTPVPSNTPTPTPTVTNTPTLTLTPSASPVPTPTPLNQVASAKFNPLYRNGEFPHAVLVEFKVQSRPASTHIRINVGATYEEVEDWFGEPGRIDGGGRIDVGQILQASPQKDFPWYEHQIHNVTVTTKRSFYLFFGGTEPFTLTEAVFDDQNLRFFKQ